MSPVKYRSELLKGKFVIWVDLEVLRHVRNYWLGLTLNVALRLWNILDYDRRAIEPRAGEWAAAS